MTLREYLLNEEERKTSAKGVLSSSAGYAGERIISVKAIEQAEEIKAELSSPNNPFFIISGSKKENIKEDTSEEFKDSKYDKYDISNASKEKKSSKNSEEGKSSKNSEEKKSNTDLKKSVGLKVVEMENRSIDLGSNTVKSILTIKDESIRNSFKNFFKNKNINKLFLYYNIYVALRNFNTLTIEWKEALKRYLPDELQDDRKLRKIQGIFSDEIGNLSNKGIVSFKNGEFEGNNVSAFSYFSITYFYQKGNSSKSFKNHILGINREAKDVGGYMPGFISLGKTNKSIRGYENYYTSTVDDEDEKVEPKISNDEENVKAEKGDLGKEDTPPETKFDGEDESETTDEKMTPNIRSNQKNVSDEARKFLSTSNYRKFSIDDIRKEYGMIDSFFKEVEGGGLIRSFEDGSPLNISSAGEDKELTPLSRSLNSIYKELEANIPDYDYKKYKEDTQRIRDVKTSAMPIVGGIKTSSRSDKSLDKLGKRVKGEEITEWNLMIENILKRKDYSSSSVSRVLSRATGNQHVSMRKNINKLGNDIQKILDTKGEKILKTDLNEIIRRANQKTKEMAVDVIQHYSDINRKHKSTLDKKMSLVNDPNKYFRRFDESSFAIDIGRYIDTIKGNFNSMLGILNEILDKYRSILEVSISKIIKEKEQIEKETSNIKGYKVLERKAFEKFAIEKLHRAGRDDARRIKQRLDEISDWMQKREEEGFSKIKMFNDLKELYSLTYKETTEENLNLILKKYDELKFLDQKEVNRRSDKTERIKLAIEKNKYGDKETVKENRKLESLFNNYKKSPSLENYRKMSTHFDNVSKKIKGFHSAMAEEGGKIDIGTQRMFDNIKEMKRNNTISDGQLERFNNSYNEFRSKRTVESYNKVVEVYKSISKLSGAINIDNTIKEIKSEVSKMRKTRFRHQGKFVELTNSLRKAERNRTKESIEELTKSFEQAKETFDTFMKGYSTEKEERKTRYGREQEDSKEDKHTGEKEDSPEDEKQGEQKTKEDAKKNINVFRRTIDGFKNRMNSAKKNFRDRMAKIAKAMSDGERMARGKTVNPEDKKQDSETENQKMASLYFKEDVGEANVINQTINKIFEPYRQKNDSLTVLTNKASSTNSEQELTNAIIEIGKILEDGTPGIIVGTYADKIITNIDNIVYKIETMLDNDKIDAEDVFRLTNIINGLIRYIEISTSNFERKLLSELESKPEPSVGLPSDAKPAITTKNIDTGEAEEDEPEENKPKNLLALAMKKIRARD